MKDLQYQLDVNTLHRYEDAVGLSLNEIGRVTLRTTQPLFYDEYRRNRTTGSFILVDEATQHDGGRRHDPRPADASEPRQHHLAPRARRPGGPAVAGRHDLVHGPVRLGQVDGRDGLRGAAGRRRPPGLRARRRQHPPRPQRRPRLLAPTTAPRTSAGSATSPAHGRRRRRRPRAARSARTAPTATRPGAPRGGRPAVRRGVRRHADRAVRAARPQGPLRQGPGRRAQGLHRHRRPLRGAAERRARPPPRRRRPRRHGRRRSHPRPRSVR